MNPDPNAVVRHLWVEQVPPSFNAVGYTGSRWALTKAAKEWKELIASLCMIERVPRGCARITATVKLTFPIVRDRDVENFRVIISKALGDALQAYGAIPNDTDEEFRLESVILGVERGVSRTDIRLYCEAPSKPAGR